MNSFDQDLALFGIKFSGCYFMDIEDINLTYGNDFSSALISKVFDFCSCGNPEVILLEISRIIKKFMDPNNATTLASDLIYFYVADRANLIEHGGSIYSSKITELGYAFIRLVEVALKEEVNE